MQIHCWRLASLNIVDKVVSFDSSMAYGNIPVATASSHTIETSRKRLEKKALFLTINSISYTMTSSKKYSVMASAYFRRGLIFPCCYKSAAYFRMGLFSMFDLFLEESRYGRRTVTIRTHRCYFNQLN